MTARPFLKWAGGKQRLVHKLAPLLPRSFGLYVESVLGGGSLFWHLAPRRAVLGDATALLVATYRAVQKDPAAVVAAFRSLCPPGRIPTEADYRRVRNEPPIGGADIDVAGWMLYVNKLGYNGLFRVNKAGKYNVAFAHPKRAPKLDEENLKACSKALRRAELVHGDFAETSGVAKDGDLVYFDPPYDPIPTNKYGVISYTKEGFGPTQQKRLRDVVVALHERGCAVVVSNSLTPRVLGLYEGGRYFVVPILAPRCLNRDTKGRGSVHEVVILAQPPPRAKAPTKRPAQTLSLFEGSAQ